MNKNVFVCFECSCPLAGNCFNFVNTKSSKSTTTWFQFFECRGQDLCCHTWGWGYGGGLLYVLSIIYIQFILSILFSTLARHFVRPCMGKTYIYKPNFNFLEMAHTNFCLLYSKTSVCWSKPWLIWNGMGDQYVVLSSRLQRHSR